MEAWTRQISLPMSVKQGLLLSVSQNVVKINATHSQLVCCAYFISRCYIYSTLENEPLVWSCWVLRFSLKMPVVNCCWATKGSPALFSFFFFCEWWWLPFLHSLCSCNTVEVCVQHSYCFGFPEFWSFPDTAVKHQGASQMLFFKVHTREVVWRDTTKSRISPVNEPLELNL